MRGLIGLTAATVVVSTGVVLWSPWSPGNRLAEGGNGRAVAAPTPSLPPPTTSHTTVLPAPVPIPAAVPAPAPVPVSGPATGSQAGPDSGWIATLHSAIPYSSVPGGAVVGTVPAANPFGAAEVLALVGRPAPDGWAQVELPLRPDGTTGWVQTGATTLTWTSYRVAVSIPNRTLTVTDGPVTVLTASVAVGATHTPTPTGQTYVWELIRPDNQRGAYGPYILGLGMYSDAISVFNGGDAQIGIHGNDDPASVGQPVSHGCVRLPNEVVTRLAGLLPLGTPVTIS